MEELANIYFDQAMNTRPDEAWEALLKEVLTPHGGQQAHLAWRAVGEFDAGEEEFYPTYDEKLYREVPTFRGVSRVYAQTVNRG